MVNANGKVLLKLLLIITMVVQPVVASYAMAGMNHAPYRASISSQYADAGHHGMMQDMSDIQHQEDGGMHHGSHALDNCCHGGACCPGAVVDFHVMVHVPGATFLRPLNISWEGIILPSETKPPRSLLG